MNKLNSKLVMCSILISEISVFARSPKSINTVDSLFGQNLLCKHVSKIEYGKLIISDIFRIYILKHEL
ncbi:MAG: hypothetical protein IJS10_03640 [Alphaproteobacteria bacterium]|nr:hypothetical protein [Alphaproteobacteria bacterium]